MTIREKLELLVVGEVSEITIIDQSQWYVLVTYRVAGTTGTAELIR